MTRFTDKGIERLRITGKRYLVTEGGGLYLEVSPKGRKKWVAKYTFNGARPWLKLGEYPAMSLKVAREENEKIQKLVSSGTDPAAVHQEISTAPTVKSLFAEWFEKGTDKRGKPWSAGHRANVFYIFRADILPAWGNRKVADITKRDIRILLQRIEKRAPNQALQVYRRLSRFFNYAAQNDVIEFSPMIYLEPIGATSRKTRWLNDDEIKIFLQSLPDANMAPQTRSILEIILRTGARPSEVCGARKSEIKGHWWTLPPARAKSNREHRVYLTPETKALFGEPNEHGLFFPSLRAADQPVAHNVLSKALRRSVTGAEKKSDSDVTIELESFTPHDLRRTCATHLAELGFTDEVIGAVLNHARRGVTATVYNQYQYDAEKQKALTAWARKLDKITADQHTQDNIVQFPGGAS